MSSPTQNTTTTSTQLYTCHIPTREAEKTLVAKQPRGRPRKRPIEEVEEDKEEEEVLSDSSDSDSIGSCILVEDR